MNFWSCTWIPSLMKIKKVESVIKLFLKITNILRRKKKKYVTAFYFHITSGIFSSKRGEDAEIKLKFMHCENIYSDLCKDKSDSSKKEHSYDFTYLQQWFSSHG